MRYLKVEENTVINTQGMLKLYLVYRDYDRNNYLVIKNRLGSIGIRPKKEVKEYIKLMTPPGS